MRLYLTLFRLASQTYANDWGGIMAPHVIFQLKTFYRGMIHVISPIFHGESNGDIYMIVQLHHGDPRHPFQKQPVEGYHQRDDQKRFDMINVLWSIFHGELNGDI